MLIWQEQEGILAEEDAVRRIVTSLCVALLIATSAPLTFTSAAINQHYTGEVATVNDIKVYK
jgi:hypothetical protein